MAAADFDAPAAVFRMLERLLDFLLRMNRTCHEVLHRSWTSIGCQLTTGVEKLIDAHNDLTVEYRLS